MVVADSSAWIDYFRSPESPIGQEVASLITSNEMAVVGPVVAEVLQGARSPAEFDFLRTRLYTLRFLDDDKDTWVMAGQLANELRRQGRTIHLSDLMIAVVAMQHDGPVFTTDAHFGVVPGLRLHRIGA